MARTIQSGDFVQISSVSTPWDRVPTDVRSVIYQIKSITTQLDLITIIIENINNSSDIKTLLIEPGISRGRHNIRIKDEVQPHQLTFESDIVNFQLGLQPTAGRTLFREGSREITPRTKRSTQDIGTGPQQYAMTGIEPVDLNILFQMDDQTLASACQTNRYISSLCQNEGLWKLRTEKYYSDAGKYKNIDRRWRDYYKILYGTTLDKEGADLAAQNGHLDVLQWMASLEPHIRPSRYGIKSAVWYNHLDVLQWITTLDPPILLTVDDIHTASRNGSLDVLQWAASLTPPVLPDVTSANQAAIGGFLNVLQWMASLDPPVLPNIIGANMAVNGGFVNVLQWMASLNPPILPVKQTN